MEQRYKKYFGYSAENPADIIVPESDHISMAESDFSQYEKVISGFVSGLSYYGSSLLLTSDFNIRHYFIFEEETDVEAITWRVNGQTLKPVQNGSLW